ncbi:RagB/SusD family nutrient uptake outer membrane protein [Chitinophaga sp. MM2321]|uniref:RagB/SusD family nutrient uptake outer membrane protein n=1 Tax=Chitinophaga sp. MM2321 TaxID=3137178 RepID=UPI0032D57B93
MKKLFIFTIVLLSVSSCQKIFDTKPLDRVSQDDVWTNVANAQTFVYNTYADVMKDFAGGDLTSVTDAYTTNTLPFDGIYNGSAKVFNETINNTYDAGFDRFSNIRACNMIIEKVGASGFADADKQALIAEGKFLRAMTYFAVARKMGRIVWIDKVLTPGDDFNLPTTANPTASYNYIIKDLEDAVAGLPATALAGRVSKFAAAAFLSEVCLEAIAYANYPAAPNMGDAAVQALVQKVITNANTAISGGYTMETDYQGMFSDRKSSSPEIIFGIYRNSINTTCEGTPMQNSFPNVGNSQVATYGGSPLFVAATRVFEAWLQHGPTQNMADAYLVVDKADPTKALPWNKTSQYLAAVDESKSPSVADIPHATGETVVKSGVIRPGSTETIWSLSNVGRDARWDASIVSDSASKYFGEDVTTCIKGNATRWLKLTGNAYYVSLSNLYWRKGIYNVSPRVYVGIPTNYHYVLMRLGRVYLNLAEAYLLKGDAGSAVTALNQTRVTHGQLPPSTASTLAAAWTDYKLERRVDLTLENDYYWSLLRWGRYGGGANYGNAPGNSDIPDLNELPRVTDISKDRKSFVTVQGAFFSANNVRVFSRNKRYLFPIAQGFIDKNSNFGPQNPNW